MIAREINSMRKKKKSIFEFESEQEVEQMLEDMMKKINSNEERKRLYEILAHP